MLSAKFDEALGIVRTISAGFSQQGEVEAYIRDMEAFILRARARRGVYLHLVDASDTPIQTAQTMESFGKGLERALRPGDRTAIVLNSALAKMQSARVRSHNQSAIFASEQEALAWLLATDEQRQAS